MENSLQSSSEVYAVWKEGFAFDGRAQGFSVNLDASYPLGHSNGPTPKELLLISLASCSGMDVVGLLKKDKQFIDHFEVVATVTASSEQHPKVFSSVNLEFNLEGAIDPVSAQRAVRLSQTTYCGVAAMLYKSMDITWTLFVNGESAGNGKANFEMHPDVHQTVYEG